jgi:hypothetical protein
MRFILLHIGALLDVLSIIVLICFTGMTTKGIFFTRMAEGWKVAILDVIYGVEREGGVLGSAL